MIQATSEIFQAFLVTPLHVARHHWMVIVASFIVCQLIYYFGHRLCLNLSSYKKLSFADQIEWQTRNTSTLHALVVFPIVFYVLLTDDKLHSSPIKGVNSMSLFALCLGIGYFTSDFVQIIRYRIQPMAPIIAHHIFAGWGFLVCVSDIGAACWYATYLLLTEATAPFNNTHWMLTKCELEKTAVGRLVGFLFAATWLVFRVMINPYLIYMTWLHWGDVLAMPNYLRILLGVNIVFLMSLNNYYFFFGPFREMVFGTAADKQQELQQQQPKKTN